MFPEAEPWCASFSPETEYLSPLNAHGSAASSSSPTTLAAHVGVQPSNAQPWHSTSSYPHLDNQQDMSSNQSDPVTPDTEYSYGLPPLAPDGPPYLFDPLSYLGDASDAAIYTDAFEGKPFPSEYDHFAAGIALQSDTFQSAEEDGQSLSDTIRAAGGDIGILPYPQNDLMAYAGADQLTLTWQEKAETEVFLFRAGVMSAVISPSATNCPTASAQLSSCLQRSARNRMAPKSGSSFDKSCPSRCIGAHRSPQLPLPATGCASPWL
jgi:hypothetical protein